MDTRRLGNSGLVVGPVAFGGNVFGWTADAATSFALLDACVDAGFNLVDTADVYSSWVPGHQGGESETIIGDWLASRKARERVLIATKVGNSMGEGKKGLRPAYIREAVDASLKRLRTDYIDLYQAHNPDPETPIADTLGEFARLIEAGKVRAIGASNHDAAQLAGALEASRKLGLPRYESVQPIYNLYDRDVFEGELAALCQRENIGVISYYALASGFLTGKYRSEADIKASTRSRSNAKYFNARGLAILAALDAAAQRHRATPGQVAIAWLLTRPGLTAPIASATSPAQFADLVRATRLELDAATLTELDRASAAAPAAR